MHGPGKWPQRWVFWIQCSPYETNKDQDFIFQLALAHLQSVRTQKHVWAPLASVSVQILSCWIVLLNIVLLNPSSCAWCTVRPNKLKCFSLEQRKAYCEENGTAYVQKAETTQWFSGKSFYRQILEEGLGRGVWPSGIVTVVFQESAISPLVPASLGSTCLFSAFSYRSWSAWGT